MSKKLLAVLVVLLLAGTVGLAAGCGGNLPKDAVAKVGSVMITQKALDERTADFEVQYAGQTPDRDSQPEEYKVFQQDVLEYMITFELVKQAAPEMSIAITDEEVQQEIDSILQDSFNGDQAEFDAALAQQGITMDQLKRSYKESMLLERVYEEAVKDVTTVPDADLQAYYDGHESEYFVPETRTARHILVSPAAGRVDGTTSTTTTSTTTATTDTSTSDSTPTASSSTTTTAAPTDADWEAALQTAQLVRQQLIAGADWTIEAKMYSDDPGSRQTGGDLGTFGKGEMLQEFEDAAFSLQKDAISEPVKTAYGYHVIQVTGINEEKQYTLDEVKEEITSIVLSELKRDAWQEWLRAQKAQVGIVYGDKWVTTTTTAAPSTETTAPATETTAPVTDTTAGVTTTIGGTGTTED